jgi:hypothetical protein
MEWDEIPDSAQEAKAQGWHMVCVCPCPTQPADLIEIILPHFKRIAFDVPFTHKGRGIEARNQAALWVKGFKWSIEGRNVLLGILYSPNSQLHPFVREILEPYLGREVLAKRRKGAKRPSRRNYSSQGRGALPQNEQDGLD